MRGCSPAGQDVREGMPGKCRADAVSGEIRRESGFENHIKE